MNSPEARTKLKEIEATDSADYVRAAAAKYLEPDDQ